jgi:hypothetical protein
MSDILRSCFVGGFATLLPPKESKEFLLKKILKQVQDNNESLII